MGRSTGNKSESHARCLSERLFVGGILCPNRPEPTAHSNSIRTVSICISPLRQGTDHLLIRSCWTSKTDMFCREGTECRGPRGGSSGSWDSWLVIFPIARPCCVSKQRRLAARAFALPCTAKLFADILYARRCVACSGHGEFFEHSHERCFGYGLKKISPKSPVT